MKNTKKVAKKRGRPAKVVKKAPKATKKAMRNTKAAKAGKKERALKEADLYRVVGILSSGYSLVRAADVLKTTPQNIRKYMFTIIDLAKYGANIELTEGHFAVPTEPEKHVSVLTVGLIKVHLSEIVEQLSQIIKGI